MLYYSPANILMSARNTNLVFDLKKIIMKFNYFNSFLSFLFIYFIFLCFPYNVKMIIYDLLLIK
jgi:hypothetical protein